MDVINIIQIIDAQILLFIQDFMRFEWLDGIMIAYTKMGNAGILWIAMSVVMLFFKKTRLAGILSLLAMGIGLMFTNFTLKPLVTRDRPYLIVEGLLPLMSPPEPNSFPSGHTTAAFAMLAIGENALSNKWLRRGLLLLAVLMAFSRLYVGVHFFTDILAGAIIGTISGAIVWNVYKYLKKREKRIEARKKLESNHEETQSNS